MGGQEGENRISIVLPQGEHGIKVARESEQTIFQWSIIGCFEALVHSGQLKQSSSSMVVTIWIHWVSIRRKEVISTLAKKQNTQLLLKKTDSSSVTIKKIRIKSSLENSYMLGASIGGFPLLHHRDSIINPCSSMNSCT